MTVTEELLSHYIFKKKSCFLFELWINCTFYWYGEGKIKKGLNMEYIANMTMMMMTYTVLDFM